MEHTQCISLYRNTVTNSILENAISCMAHNHFDEAIETFSIKWQKVMCMKLNVEHFGDKF